MHMQTAVVRFTYDTSDDPEYLRRLYGSVFTFVTLLSGTLFGLGVLAAGPVLKLTGVSSFWLPYIYLALVIAATRSSYEILQRIMQAHHQAGRFVVQQWMFFVVGVSVTVVLMVGFGVGGFSLVIGSAVTNAAFHMYALLYGVRCYGVRLERRLIRECLSYSVPLLPNRFAGLIPNLADRLFLSAISVGTAGIYSVGYQLGNGLSYVSVGFFRAHLPWFFAIMREGEVGHRQITKVARRAILLVSALGLIIALFAEEAIRLALDSAYHEAWKVVPLAVFAVVFNSVKELWLRPLTFEKSGVKFVPIATYAFAVLSVGFMALMVPAFGIIGAAGAILAARFLSGFLMLFFSLKVQNIGYPVWEIYGIAIVGFALSSVAYLPIEGLLLIKLLLATVVTATVAAVTRSELAQLVRLIRRQPVIAPL